VTESLTTCFKKLIFLTIVTWFSIRFGTWYWFGYALHNFQRIRYARESLKVFELTLARLLAGSVTFLTNEVTFLGYIIIVEGIRVGPSKVEAINSWPIPKSIHYERSFHGLASFYRRFIKNFSFVGAPLTDCIKGDKFQWTEQAQKSFDNRKQLLTKTPVVTLPDFDQVFEVSCDASNSGICVVLCQEGPITFFSEKLNNGKLRYSTYDKELYAIVRAMQYLSHYLLNKECILYSDHEALKHLNSQQKINHIYAAWNEFLQVYSFLLKHKA